MTQYLMGQCGIMWICFKPKKPIILEELGDSDQKTVIFSSCSTSITTFISLIAILAHSDQNPKTRPLHTELSYITYFLSLCDSVTILTSPDFKVLYGLYFLHIYVLKKRELFDKG